jgi:hypothetical protein
MWKTKTFKTKEQMENFIKYYSEKYGLQWNEIFINNGYGIEYRLLKVININ